MRCFKARWKAASDAKRRKDVGDVGIDTALRIGELPDSALVIGEVHRVFAASPAYLKFRGMPKTSTDLLGYDCVGVQGFTGPVYGASATTPKFRLAIG